MNILAIIPARSGSKSIPHKNIMSIHGKPLIAHSIEHALTSNRITRTIVSTDSDDYATVAKKHGAEIPFLRPSEFAQDMSTDIEVFYHALTFLKEKENYIPEIVVHLRPTSPIRDPKHIDEMIELLINNPDWDSIRSVALAPETPFKMWFEKNGVLVPVVEDEKILEAYNQPRQLLPKVYLQNASIDIMRSKTILDKKSMTGDIIGAYIMKKNYDIDHIEDLAKLREIKIANSTNKTFCFDIDGVIAQLQKDNNYELSEPNFVTIEKINKLHANNNYIILFTARGSKTGIDWEEITRKQMNKWGVKYHELKFGKPAADYYIDDRLINIEQL